MSKPYTRILRWLFISLKKKIRNDHLSRVHNDIRCPNCKEWFSISGVDNNHKQKYHDDKQYYVCECGKCGHKSNWSPHIFPFPTLVDDAGSPL